tara:strand:+ start:836 stop:1978 length:1143 start_codon:yes stop_codon:yes gene_type:complete
MNNNWIKGTIKDLVIPVEGKWDPVDNSNSLPYVGLEHLNSEQKNINKYGDSKTIKSLKNCFSKGDTLFGKLRPYLKKVAFADKEGICSTDILPLRANSNSDNSFVYYLLSSQSIIAKAVESSAGNVMPRTSWKDIADLDIDIPPLPEQKKIAEILSGMDKVRNCYIRKKKKIVLCLEGLLSESFNDLKQNTPLIKIASFGDVITGSTPSTSEANYYGGNIPFISPADINDDLFIDETKTKLTLEGLKMTRSIPEGSICVVCIGSTIGKVAISSRNSATNQQINSIMPGNYNKYYLYAAIKFFSKIIKQEASTHAVPIINKSKFSSLELPNPPLEIQQKIGRLIKDFNLMIDLLEKKTERLEKIKLALSSDLLSGRKRVNV